MPHLILEYSDNLDGLVAWPEICERFRAAMAGLDLFPVAGVRVRAHAARAYAIADGDERNSFAHLILRVGAGRDELSRKEAGQVLFDLARELFAERLTSGYFALSMEMVEIHAVLTWKANGIRRRMAATA